MNWRYSGLTLILIAATTLPRILTLLTQLVWRPSLIQVDISSPQDAESVFARGDRLPIQCADISELEMIRGISDTTATNILLARDEMIKRFAQGGSELAALGIARGVGPATAKTLVGFLRFDGACDDDRSYAPFEWQRADLKR